MKAGAFYNEHDPFAAAWLRELIAEGHIAPGVVDERSIVDVRPTDLEPYGQCHFFAGIGGWSLALRMAGVPDNEPVWTGSCPCQPFSAAGKRGGFDDARHLWPVWFELIRACRPKLVFGEQVASAQVVGGPRKGPGVSASISAAPSRQGLGATRQGQGWQEGRGLRSGRTSAGHTGDDRLRSLCGDGPAVQLGRGSDLGQPFAGSDQPEGRLHVRKHPGGLSRGEQRDRRLGRGATPEDCESDHGETSSPFERALEAARRELDQGDGDVWIDAVRFDLEAAHYAFGACDLPAAGVGAPHIRQRLWWVGLANAAVSRHSDAEDARADRGSSGSLSSGGQGQPWLRQSERARAVGGMADAGSAERRAQLLGRGCDLGQASERHEGSADAGERIEAFRLANAGGQGTRRDAGAAPRSQTGGCGAWSSDGHHGCDLSVSGCPDGGMALAEHGGREGRHAAADWESGAALPSGEGHWSDLEWLPCRDGKARPTRPGLFPLAHGVSGRVGLLRGAGNAISPPAAAAFIRSVIPTFSEPTP